MKRWPAAELAAELNLTATAGGETGPALNGSEPPPDPLPPLVQRAVDHPDTTDRSAAHHRLIGACVDSGLTKAQTVAVAALYSPSKDKYGARLAAEIERSWHEVIDDRQRQRRDYTLTVLPTPPNNPVDGEAPPSAVLEFHTFADLAARVDAAGPRRWLLRGIWPAGDYGVHAAEQKAQKTWNTADLAVAVASGTPWLGKIPVDKQGPVLMFVGEGGQANTVRRIRAIAAERDLTAEELPIVVCTRAPHLNNTVHITLMAEKIYEMLPALVTLDPLYLAAAGANLRDLYGMGELLERPQHICQAVGAALWVVTHFNRKEGSGAGRITGAGPAEWGRVIVSAAVKSRRTEPDTQASDVITELEIIGGEVPDQTYRLHRRIQADDPDDLDSALCLVTTVSATVADTDDQGKHDTPDDLPPATKKILEAITAANGPTTSRQMVDWISSKYGHGLKRPTVSSSLTELRKHGLVCFEEIDNMGRFPQKYWSLHENPKSPCQHVSLNIHGDTVGPVSPRVTTPVGGDTVTGPTKADTARSQLADTATPPGLCSRCGQVSARLIAGRCTERCAYPVKDQETDQ